MDQKIASAGGKLTAVLLWFCGLIMLPVAIGALLSYPDAAWMIGALMLLSCVLLFISGVSSYKKAGRMQQEADRDMALVSKQIKKKVDGVNTIEAKTVNVVTDVKAKTELPQVSDEDPIVLVHWKYMPGEWEQFTKQERKTRKSNTTIQAILIIVLGAGYLVSWKNTSFGVAIAVCLIVAIAYWLGKYFLSMASIGESGKQQSEVIITQYAVIINGKYNAFFNEIYKLEMVNIIENDRSTMVEIIYTFKTRNGTSSEEIRVPIPAGKMEEARWLQKTLMDFR